MRKILFRGKRADNGEYMPGSYGDWVYGSYGLKLNVATGEHDEYIMESVYNGATNSSYFVDYKIIPGTAGQYTGFTDQNKNKIFEGDILELSGSYEEVDGTSVDCIEHYEVKYKNAAFYACSVEHKVMLSEIVSSMEIIDSLTIIGNIHDEEE